MLSSKANVTRPARSCNIAFAEHGWESNFTDAQV